MQPRWKATPLHRPAQDGRLLFVHEGDDLVHHLDDLDLGAEGSEESGELDSDHAAADNAEPLGHFFQLEEARRVHYPRIILSAGDRGHRRSRARRDDDRRSLVDRRGPSGVARLDLADPEEPRLGGQHLDAQPLLGRRDAGAELLDNLALPGLHRGPVEARSRGLDAVFLALEDMDIMLGGVEESLGRDAAHVEAGAAQRLLLYQEDLLLPRAQALRGDIAAGTAADDDDVVRSHSYLMP